LDPDLETHREDLFGNCEVIADLNFRCVRVDAARGKDDFHVIQGLRDTSEGVEEPKCYAWQRWGATGSRGGHSVEGPLEEAEVRERLAEVFHEKTGAALGEINPGDPAVADGMYWLVPPIAPSREVQWQYYVSDGVDGKAPGWYPYQKDASMEMEEIFATHRAAENDPRTAVRVISSGYFSYTVDLTNMNQTNTKTKKQRDIRRAEGTDVQADDAEAEAYAGKKKKATIMAKPAAAAPIVAAPAAPKAKGKAKVKKAAKAKAAKKPKPPPAPETKPLTLDKTYAKAAKKTKMTKKQIRAAMEAVVEIAAEQAAKFGKFRLAKAINMKLVTKKATEEYVGTNPFTKAPHTFKAKPERKTVRAKPSKFFLRTLSKPVAAPEA